MTFGRLIERRSHYVYACRARRARRYVARMALCNKVCKTWQCERFTAAQCERITALSRARFDFYQLLTICERTKTIDTLHFVFTITGFGGDRGSNVEVCFLKDIQMFNARSVVVRALDLRLKRSRVRLPVM